MDPVLISLLAKLDEVLKVMNKSGKKGLPDDSKSNAVTPAADGSTIDPSSQPPKDPWLKKVGTFFGVSQGGLMKKSNIVTQTKIFAGAFLPELAKTIEIPFAKVIKVLDKIAVNTAGGESSGGGISKVFGSFSLSGLAKSALIIIPALIGLAYAIKQWQGIEIGAIVKVLSGIGLMFLAFAGFATIKDKVGKGMGSLFSLLLTMTGFAVVIFLFKKSLEGWESIPYESLVKVGSVIGGLSLIVFGLSKIPLKDVTVGLLTLTGIGLLMVGLGHVLPPLAQALQMMSSVNVEDIGKVGLIIGGIAALAGILGLIAKTGIGVAAFAAGAVVLVGAGALAYALAQLLPPLATALKLMQGVEWSDIGKVATIITGIVALAGILGAISITGVGAAAFAAGAAVILGAVGVAFALNELIPPLSQSLKSMQGVEWSDIGKVGTIIGGLEVALAAAGLLSPLIAPGLLVFKGMISVANEMQSLLPKIATSIESLSGLSNSDIQKAFDLLKVFMTGSGVLFSGEGFFGKVGSFFKSLVGGTSASVLVAPYIALASEIATLSNYIKIAVNNITSIGDSAKINTSLETIKAFLSGSGSFSEIASPESLRAATTGLQGLVSVIPSLGQLSNTLVDIKTSLKEINTLKTFDSFNSTLKLKTDEPLKVDMSTTNEILTNIYTSSQQMVNLLKNMPIGTTTNLIMGGGNRGSVGTQTGSTVGRGAPSFSGSPYNSAPMLGVQTPMRASP